MLQLFKKRENIYVLLLCLVVVTASIGYKINAISIILLGVFYVFDKNLLTKIKSVKPIVPYLFFGCFFLHVLGYFYSENKIFATHEIEVRLSFLLLPLVIFTEKISKQTLYKLFVVLKYWFIIYAVYLIHYKILVEKGPLFALPTTALRNLTQIHHAYFSLFYMFGLVFTIYQVQTKKIEDVFGYLQVLFFLFFIAVLGARVTVSVAALLLLIFFIQQSLKSTGLKQLVMAVLLIASCFLIVFKTNFTEKFSRLSKVEWNIEKNIYNHQVFSFDFNESTSNTLELRLIKWYSAFQIFKQAPLIGVGSGDYKEALYDQYEKLDFKKGMAYKYNTHNQYLEEFLKFGIIGGVFFIFFIGYIIIDAFKKKYTMLLLLAITMSAFLLIESVFERQHGVLFFTFFIPILYVYYQEKEFKN